MKYIVYQTTNTKNNKIYIGVHKTGNPDIFDGYIGCGIKITNPSSYMNPITPLQYAVKKYGTGSFKRSILQIFDTIEEAFNLEKILVNQEFINRKDTYNAKIGGLGGSSYSTKINQFTLKGEYIKTWDSIIEASEFYNVSDTAIHNASKFKGKCRDYFWSKEPTIDVKEYSNTAGQICYKYSSEGKYIENYNSLPEAAKINNTSLQSIQRAVKGGYKVGDYYYSLKLHEEYLGKEKVTLKNALLYVYSLEGEYLTTLRGISEMCEFFNIKTTGSLNVAIRTNRQYKNYQISLEYREKMDKIHDKRNTKKKVAQYTLSGDFVREFDSITLAVAEFGTGVQKVLKGQQKQCKNFIFRYIS